MSCRAGSRCADLNGGVCGGRGSHGRTTSYGNPNKLTATESIKALIDPKFARTLSSLQKAGINRSYNAEAAKAHLEKLGFEKSENSLTYHSINGDSYEARFDDNGRVKCTRHDPSTDIQSDYFADTHYDSLNKFMEKACIEWVIDGIRKENGDVVADQARANLNTYQHEAKKNKLAKVEANKAKKFNSIDPKMELTVSTFYSVLRSNNCKFGSGACLVSNDKLIKIKGKDVFFYEADSKGSMPFKEKLPMTKETLTKLGLKF
jgi:hypothetical protein